MMSRVGHRRNKGHSSGSRNRQVAQSSENLTRDLESTNYRFFCQLAHGSPTGIIKGFTTVRELYGKIAECFDLDPSQIMFCTLNTHKLDMEKLLCFEIGLDDFLFAHIRGQPKEIHIRKDRDAFGLTLTDNGCGVVIIKRIHSGGLMENVAKSCEGMIEVGDQIEAINHISFAGKRHFEVASYLQSIPVGEVFCLRLISPERSPIYMLGNRTSRGASRTQLGSGKRTIRMKQNGLMEERQVFDNETQEMNKINRILGRNLGFEDNELAYLISKLAKISNTSSDLARSLRREWFELDLPDAVILEIWHAVKRRPPVPPHYRYSHHIPEVVARTNL